MKKTLRNSCIAKAHREGKPFAALGKEYNLSPARVAQIFHKQEWIEKLRNRPWIVHGGYRTTESMYWEIEAEYVQDL